MINWVIRVFEENKNVLSDYQERFQYVLVDEFQDTSGTQNRLVELLINYWDEPNVFVVGDDDQSIFRFQGANVENMLSFANSYKESLLTVVLTKNYRSTQPILDISKSLIDRNEERLVKQIDGLSKELSSSHPKIKDLKHPPVMKEYETQKQEIIDITIQVEKLIAKGTAPGKIGIIYKEHKYGQELSGYFKLRNIPVYSKRFENLLDMPLAKKILLIMRYLAAEQEMSFSADEMLFELLHAEWFNIPAIEIAKVTAECAARKYSANPVSLRLLIHEKATEPAKDLFSGTYNKELKLASEAIEKLVSNVPNMTLQHLFEAIIRETGILKHVMTSPEKIEQLQIITALFDFIKDETHRNPSLDLASFMKTIELMIKEDLSLPLVQVSGTERGVNLMTTHGSKGLEFTHVFLVGCNANIWEKKRKPGGGYTYPDTLFSTSLKKTDDEELRRLFYVALTRAEQHLQISWSKFKADGKEQEPSMFIAEIQEQHGLAVENVFIDSEVLSNFAALYFDEPAAPELEKIEADFVDRILDKFVMNVTALNNYLSCPLEFYFKNLIRIPSPKNEATEFGSAVHYALEQLFRKMQQNDNHFPEKSTFIEDFEWYMNRHRESFTNEQFKRRMDYGHDVLNNYYDTQVPYANKIVAIERNIRNVVVKNVPLKGKLDKLEFDGKNVNVVDYKSGNPDNAKEKTYPPNEKYPNGGDYWRQAVFYKILVDNYDQKDWKVVSTEFDFIEPDKNKKYKKAKLVIQPEDTETVTQQISTVWEKIKNKDFYTGCGKPDCHWCNFVKTNNMAIALHEIETENEEETI
jgi:DNA helicase II / ATP-dependent DNA helicase PcrA